MKKYFQSLVGPHLPFVHLRLKSGLKNVILDLFFHPIKRRIAKLYVYILQNYFGLTVIGITGSAGKTTTKEMLAGILKLKGNTVWSKENIDSVFNIPSTILKCFIDTKYLILEMGVEYPHEMDFYLWLVRPIIGVVTNVFPTHTEFFGDEKGVAGEKGKLISSLPENGFAVLNSSNILTKDMAKLAKSKVYYFDTNVDPTIQNSNTAKKVAEILKVSNDLIDKGLKTYQNPKHRLFQFQHQSGAIILDDSYNSNPEATLSTLRVFNKLAGNNKKIAVLGDMLELGKLEEGEHRRVGKEVSKSKFDVVIGVGILSRYLIDEVKKSKSKTFLVNDQKEVLSILLPLLSKDTYVLIKGSRSIGLDKLIDKLV
ncbi:hypothetical protein A2422_02090 [Candidatus Woesebacteria bacterium RIFOXYC1_FULL_31_51]|uniref:UDP-N-acetylmuramoyl-tripeptide-D-alanyl-D-alanine ligase n=1 Tax=Candidatus Woesebacteria bacterium GW2011_GWC2_31_9 TaxID=1618586 RepID=A0A0G0AWM1_9BACT|nr:MAG: UDP-N-acetylmuramoylalanyl-D-glutamyl-2,6-diaminopimelate/D-alanyl-D-alanyl ligase, UDP-N-acetylmuramoyl-tripeptide--D-alanyl-D-alanine ligase [Candidatus Woesebacteria bacterium GW2011_GWF1_31_35]KKP23580.1 MAG: UDP-N-acetylmuramoyl-tripeptide-D-alanyl-D-alanine ligase [Candidatus Woesebacteria bacterium GW2011_GWC1_30_29]KKP27038.1 MAG: UDP-N-acetylmuramoyl-tripeptide-D-alanyl-D-alanine ligase [Candidatus Woesebacteria bacterium GW2011_GWD1_31_12]KKP27856.1 MAG: UDP-N-acetylmuramoyl-tr